MLKFTDLSLRRGSKALLYDVCVTFYAGQRVGLTGANGSGKSSLFALIRNEIHADAGDISIPASIVIAHVAQETPAVDKPAIEYVLDGDSELREFEKQLQTAEHNNEGEKLAQLYSELEAIDAYTANSRAARLLHGLGFSRQQEQTPVREFSGGWRMRLNLAQALMCRSELLLLDEPTNHLDLETVIWLEEWLRQYSGMLLLISHDRDFLDRVATHIAHIEQQNLHVYTGNYSDFEIRRAENLAHQQAAFEKQQREIAHMQKFVERFRAKATKARQAQSRIKALERMTIISQAHIDSPFHFHFSEPGNLPTPILSLSNASVAYAENVILKNLKLTITGGDRIGLLGHNGAGKSTLIKLLAGEIACKNGQRVEAKEINIGYFAQHQLEQLDDEASPLLHLQRIDQQATEKDLRKYLGGFAFQNDMATSVIADFSGGEKARLVLALIVYQKPNLLLLDEPTNHLDLEMRYALTCALQEFEGAMIVVSHDRHLLRTVTDTLLLVANGEVNPFDGDLDDYRNWVRQQDNENEISLVNKSTNNDIDTVNKKQQRQQSASQRKQLKPLQNKVNKLEKKLDTLNALKISQQNMLSDSTIYNDENKKKLQVLLKEQHETILQCEEIELQWLQLYEELDLMDH